jgi:hypothetical protein
LLPSVCKFGHQLVAVPVDGLFVTVGLTGVELFVSFPLEAGGTMTLFEAAPPGIGMSLDELVTAGLLSSELLPQPTRAVAAKVIIASEMILVFIMFNLVFGFNSFLKRCISMKKSGENIQATLTTAFAEPNGLGS